MRLGGGRFVGSFVVGAGVVLDGEAATVVGPGGDLPALCVAGSPEGEPTRVESLTIENDGLGVLVVGGRATFDAVSIDVERGMGLVGSRLDTLTIRASSLTGPISADRLAEIGADLDADQYAIAGLLIDRSSINLEAVDVRQFAGFGAAIIDSDLTWRGGRVEDNVGTGVLLEAGVSHLEEVEVLNVRRGEQVGFAINPFGVVASAGAQILGEGLTVRRIDGIGVLQDDATAEYRDLIVEESDDVAVWVQATRRDAPALTIVGDSRLTGNRGAGIHVREAGPIRLEDLVVSGTRTKPYTSEMFGQALVGDGIQIGALQGVATLVRLRIQSNERIGLLIDGAEQADASYRFEDVVIGGEGEFGFIPQNGDVDPDGVRVESEEMARNDQIIVMNGEVLALLPTLVGPAAIGAGLVGEGGVVTEAGRLRRGVRVDEDRRLASDED